MTTFRPAAALAFALAAAVPFAPAFASSGERDGRETRRVEESRALAAAPVDAAAAIAAVRAAGHGPVRGIEWERGRWEVKTIDAQGRRATFNVDAASGAVTPRGR
ncbi:PepSY domain-containing protein [Roseomonas sp. PWR1]|uniref:PepSY domain-containing protein n=1 Tax=Roseomonas nitratireducens TaxID=2820810 RepID=A0ABS4AUZ1_9PROT|nr:PepSY domain-containing protein [Neoroseomonas nitratireducens]MBP0465189.1 PepSY domain-containing protein [Neoroseomonas nitratireducens]